MTCSRAAPMYCYDKCCDDRCVRSKSMGCLFTFEVEAIMSQIESGEVQNNSVAYFLYWRGFRGTALDLIIPRSPESAAAGAPDG